MSRLFLWAAFLAAGATTASTLVLAADGRTPDTAPTRLEPGNLVSVKEIAVPIVESSRVYGVLHLDIAVDAGSAAAAARLTERMPELRATLVMTALEFSRLHASPASAVDVERLRTAMGQALDDQMSENGEVLVLRVAARKA